MKTFFKSLTVVIVCLVSFSLHSYADVRLPKLISNGMVLQRDRPLKIWGWATPGENVAVTFNKKTYKTVTGNNGRWQVVLKPMAAGGPFTMIIAGKNSLTVTDILLGDVWFCSGQSNMEMSMGDVAEKYEKFIAQNQNVNIRQFLVPKNLDEPFKIHDDFGEGNWAPATGSYVNRFSAAAYFFAISTNKREQVPVGIINASWGGTPIEAWISEDNFKTFPETVKLLGLLRDTAYVNRLNRNNNENNRIQAARTDKSLDEGLSSIPKWYETSYSPVKWKDIMVPGFWSGQGLTNFNGVVWYRREFNVPASFKNQTARLYFGRIYDNDEVYINGQLAGKTNGQYGNRMYALKEGLLVPGKNIIVGRLSNNSPSVGGVVPDKPYYIVSGTDTIALSGKWQYKVGQSYASQMPALEGYSAANQPTFLYNTMVAPVSNYAIKGALWYQGESNVTKAKEYERLLTQLITNWRNTWQNSKLPFIIAQLPGYQEVSYLPGESAWAELREAQRRVTAMPYTGLTVLIDVGEWGDIHPRNKKDVGERLALMAGRVAYNLKDVVPSGPVLKNAKAENDKIILTFTNAGSGLIAKDDSKLNHFAIAGADKKFVWATANINGNQIIVSSQQVARPVYVRYAWANNPDRANLYNVEGLPASPFEVKVP